MMRGQTSVDLRGLLMVVMKLLAYSMGTLKGTWMDVMMVQRRGLWTG